MEITVSEFRKNIKNYFDASLNGDTVCIERGGVHFNLTARLPWPTTEKDQVIVAANSASPIKPKVINPTLLNPNTERLLNGICKTHGTPLDLRGRCMQKGCKYG